MRGRGCEDGSLSAVGGGPETAPPRPHRAPTAPHLLLGEPAAENAVGREPPVGARCAHARPRALALGWNGWGWVGIRADGCGWAAGRLGREGRWVLPKCSPGGRHVYGDPVKGPAGQKHRGARSGARSLLQVSCWNGRQPRSGAWGPVSPHPVRRQARCRPAPAAAWSPAGPLEPVPWRRSWASAGQERGQVTCWP